MIDSKTHRLLNSPCKLQPGDEFLMKSKWHPIEDHRFAEEISEFIVPIRRPIFADGTDMIDTFRETEYSNKQINAVIREGDDAITPMPGGINPKEEPWQHVNTCDLWPGKNLPVPIADGDKKICAYLGYVDVNNKWRNASNKSEISPQWWLTQWPDFPIAVEKIEVKSKGFILSDQTKKKLDDHCDAIVNKQSPEFKHFKEPEFHASIDKMRAETAVNDLRLELAQCKDMAEMIIYKVNKALNEDPKNTIPAPE